MLNLVKRAAAEQFTGAGLSLAALDSVLDAMYGGFPVWSGAQVSVQTALSVSTFWACVSAISDDVATLPTLPYRRTFGEDGKPNGREIAFDHYLYPLLLYQANQELSSWRFFQLMQAWLLCWGNACAEMVVNGRGQITELWPWRWDRTKVTRKYEGGPLQYQYHLRNGNYTKPVPQNRMFHMRGLGIDGVIGMDPVETHKQTIGLNLAVTEHGARYYSQGAKMGGVLQSPNPLSDKAFQRVQKTIRDTHEGLSNAHRLLVLEEGLQWKETSDNMVNAAYIAANGMTAQDIARIMKVPQHRVGLLPSAPSSNVEEMSTEYVLYTLSPWCANWQNQIHCDMLSDRENQSIYTAFDFTNLLRGNHKDMAAFVSALSDRGILNADEIRAKYLDLNAEPDGAGADYYRAVNMAPVGEEGKNALTSPANMNQVQKVQKKQPKNQNEDEAPPSKKNGHAALEGIQLGDNLINALIEFVAAHHRVN